MSNYNLDFISESDFESHVANTLATYNKSLKSINLKNFNSNIVDPIKLLFDKSVYKKSFEDIISMELQRQRDKSNTNAIGYFHQNMFKYIKNCTVPEHGWDVIYNGKSAKIYVEMKNKHNTMNAASSQKTYMGMQNQILKTPNDYCYLVETIAPASRNITWGCSVNGEHLEHKHIRRVSMDVFYAEVTGQKDAFFKLCMQLPITIKKLLDNNSVQSVESDTVLDELKKIHPNMLYSLYLLAFKTYDGFGDLIEME